MTSQKKSSGSTRRGKGTYQSSRSSGKRSSAHTVKGRKEQKSGLGREIGGWITVLILLLLTLAIYLKNSMGVAGESVNELFVGLFGFSAYVITLYSLIIGLIALFSHPGKGTWVRMMLGYAVMVLLSAFIHVVASPELDTPSLMYKEATIRTGGLVGGLVGRGLMNFAGRVGAVLIIIFLWVIIAIILTGRSLVSGMKKAGQKTSETTEKVRVYSEQKVALRRQKREERLANETLRAQEKAAYPQEEMAEERPHLVLSKEDEEGDRQIAIHTGADDLPDVRCAKLAQEEEAEAAESSFLSALKREKETDQAETSRQLEQPKPSRKAQSAKGPVRPIDDGAVDIPLIDHDPYLERKKRFEHSQKAEENPADNREVPWDADEWEQETSAQRHMAQTEEKRTEEGQHGAEDSTGWNSPASNGMFDITNTPKGNGASTAEKNAGEMDDTGHISTGKIFDKEEFPTGIEDQAETLRKAGAEETASVVRKKTGPTGVYQFPPMDLLNKGSGDGSGSSREELLKSARKLEDVLATFKVDAKVVQVNKGPTVTRYEVQPALGVKVSSILNLQDDIAMNLAASSIRIEAPIPGKNAVGIEIPNKEVSVVMLRDVLESDTFRHSKSNLTFALGKDIDGEVRVSDIAKMPHLLIAGTTGSGKSVCINSMIISLIYKASPNDVKLILIDPKIVELSIYNGIPHLLLPVVTDVRQAAGTLNWAVQEMTKRYKAFADANVRDLKGYNELAATSGGELSKMPQIVIIIDELADLMMTAGKEVEPSIVRLAQLARACGIHLVIATQRPSVDVITGLIKANIPSRIAFAVSQGVDSRTILDSYGAEKLLGRGDMLYWPMTSSKAVRIQGAFVSDHEVERVVEFVKQQPGSSSEYDPSILNTVKQSNADHSGVEEEIDEYLEDAMRLVVEKQRASISMLQRAFRIGFNRAARLMDALEDRGVVAPDEGGGKPRKVLMNEEELENSLNE